MLSGIRVLSPPHFMHCPRMTNGIFWRQWNPGVRELCQLSDKAKPQLVAARVRHGSAGASVQGSQLQGLGIPPVAAPHSSLTAKSLPCPFKTQHTFSYSSSARQTSVNNHISTSTWKNSAGKQPESARQK